MLTSGNTEQATKEPYLKSKYDRGVYSTVFSHLGIKRNVSKSKPKSLSHKMLMAYLQATTPIVFTSWSNMNSGIL